jgi:HD-GYP domain-containing protein (c-di-GMP phosphodiesterase class II)
MPGAPSLRIKELEEQLRSAQSSIVCALSQLLDLRDLSTGTHSTRLGEWAVRLAVDFGLDEEYQRSIEVACLVHDVGKIGVPDAVLQKAGPLTPVEREAMDRHPEFGWAILRLLPGLELASLFALHHHERWDGGGYPGGLEGEGIPFGARVVTIVDAFDAMVSDRCYRRGLGFDEAARRLRAGAGSQFDPRLVGPFVELARENLSQVREATDEPEPRLPVTAGVEKLARRFVA